ncbi:MAG: hydrogenase maturation nickel metallochaperone HypA [Gammaproteobacteria bacterium]
MHELSICQDLLEQVDRVAHEHGARRVARIHLAVGPLSGVVPELLQQAFTLARAGSSHTASAELEIETVPVRVRCHRCGAETDAHVNRLLCGQCGDYHTDLVSGDELILQRVELEDAAASA